MTSLTAPRSRGIQAFGLAAVVEVCILSAAAAVVAWSAPLPPPPAPIPIQLTQAEPEPPKPEPPKPPKPQPRHQEPKPLPMPRPVPQAPQPVPRPVAPTPFSEPLLPPPPPPPAPSSAGKPDPALSYAGRVHAAVQAAVVYPSAAAAMNYAGRTRVEFSLQDGIPSRIRVVQGSGLGMIDRAALKAVQDASYPPPPAPLLGKELNYQIWVEFKRN